VSLFCVNCGTKLEDGNKFCKECGNAVEAAPSGAVRAPVCADGAASPNVVVCADGKLRWTYELKLCKNPVLFNTTLTIFLCILAALWVFINLICLDNYDYWPEGFLSIGKVFLIAIPCVSALAGLSYLIYALIMGWEYCAVFEMDEVGVNHIQMPKQYKKAQVIGIITALTGALTGNMGTAGDGLLSMGRQSMYSEFARVRRVKALRRNDTIKVNGRLKHNQIYAPKEEFEFVLRYISAHCPQAKQSFK